MDIEDVMDAILNYFETNLNTYIDEMNTLKADDYVISYPTAYELRPQVRGRQNPKIQFTLQRDDIIINDKTNSIELNIEVTNLGCFVTFYDSGTVLDYRKGLRYEKVTKNCLKGLSYQELGAKLIGSQNAPFIESQSDKRVPQGLLISGAVLQVTLGG